jgi:hypothetical protein
MLIGPSDRISSAGQIPSDSDCVRFSSFALLFFEICQAG